MTPGSLVAGMRVLYTTWPQRAPSPATARDLSAIYGEALADLTNDEFERSVKAAIRDCRFFPVPAELRAFARPPAPARDFELDYDPIRNARANLVPWPALPPGPQLSQEERDARQRATLERMAGFDRGRRERLEERERARRRRGVVMPPEVLAELAAVRERMRGTADTATPAGG